MKIVCSVYDNKARLFSTPFFAHSKTTAVRDFHTAALDPASQINKFPGDYELWVVGEWDDETGNIQPLSQIEFVTKAHALIDQE